MEEMSESEPSRTHRYSLKVLSKPGLTIGSGISWDEACLWSQWQPVYRRHELHSGFGTERENLVADAKGNDKWLTP
jgi:hypothetical protein